MQVGCDPTAEEKQEQYFKVKEQSLDFQLF